MGRTTGSNAAVSVYSDDHGKSWQAGNPVTGMLMDENKVVELSDVQAVADLMAEFLREFDGEVGA